MREVAIDTIAKACRHPNISEGILQGMLDYNFPDEWTYVGNGVVNIGGRVPDFIHRNGRQLVIELFGNYWHDPLEFPNKPTEGELIAHYKGFGYDCLVLWEYELIVGVVVSKVKNLLKGGG